jgi:hypothetical protein
MAFNTKYTRGMTEHQIKGKMLTSTSELGKVQCECHLLLCILSGGTNLTAFLICYFKCFKSWIKIMYNLENLDTEVDVNIAWKTIRENIKISAKESRPVR